MIVENVLIKYEEVVKKIRVEKPVIKHVEVEVPHTVSRIVETPNFIDKEVALEPVEVRHKKIKPTEYTETIKQEVVYKEINPIHRKETKNVELVKQVPVLVHDH